MFLTIYTYLQYSISMFRPRHRKHIHVVLLVVITALVFGSVISFDFVSWDDPKLVTNNPAVQSLSLDSLKTIFTTYDPELYVPFTLLSYQIEHFFFGLNPTVFHFTNLLLHVLNILLVFWIIVMMTKRKRSLL